MSLARYQFTVVDDAGNVLPAASVEVRREVAGAPLAILYADREGATPIGNPFAADSDGFAAFHVVGGAYRIIASKGGFSRTWRYVGIGTAQEIDHDLIVFKDANDDVVDIRNFSLSGYIDFDEIPDASPEEPDAPASNVARVHAGDSGDGVTSLRMKNSAGELVPLSHFLQRGDDAINRLIAAKVGDWVSVLDFIPIAEHDAIHDRSTTTNLTAYIQSAIDSLTDEVNSPPEERGGTVIFPPGLYLVSGLVLKTGVVLQGAGINATVLFQPTNGNADVILTEGFYSLIGTDENDINTPHDFGIIGMTIDGNGDNQNGSGGDSINGLALYGYRYILRQIYVRNAKRHGILSEWGPFGDFSMESHWENVTVDTCGRHGVWHAGPHDTNFHKLHIIDASQETDNTYDGLLLTGNMNGRFVNFHAWHRSTATNRVLNQLRDMVGASEWIASHFEGGRRQIYSEGAKSRFLACLIYAHFGATNSAMVQLESNDNIFVGCQFDGTNEQYYAVQIGTAAGPARAGNVLADCIFNGFQDNTPFNFGSDGGNFIFARGFAGGGGATSFGGTINPATVIRYVQGGTVIDYSNELLPNVFADRSGVIIGHSGGDITPDRPLVVRGGPLSGQFEKYSADASPNGLLAFKSRNATVGSHTVLQSNDEVARFEARGSDGDQFVSLGYLTFHVDGAPGDNDMPGRASIWTTPDGSNAPVERFRINAAGMPVFAPGSASPATLDANGQITLTLTSNTNLRLSARGSDGTTRVANITLA